MKQKSIFAMALGITAAVAAVGAAIAQGTPPAQEITFFSNPGMSGARFTVTGARNTLSLPYVPRSAALQGGGRWEVCSQEDYRGRCEIIAASQRDFVFGQVRSIRALQATASVAPWREIARLDVRDRADRDLLPSNDRQTDFRQVMVCSERNTIRVRRAEVQLGSGQWQRLFIPLTLSQGECSKAIDLLGGARRLRAVRFEYEAWSAGMARGTIAVRALPQVTVQPR